MDKILGIFEGLSILAGAYLLGYPLDYFIDQLIVRPYTYLVERSVYWAEFNEAYDMLDMP